MGLYLYANEVLGPHMDPEVLKEIKTPTLMLGAKYDTMDPKYME
jgi:hypothetical protein